MIMHSLILSREGLTFRLAIFPCPQGWIDNEENVRAPPKIRGGIGESIPSDLGISLDPQDFSRASPSGNLLGLRKSLGRRGWISQYLPRFGGARIQSK